MTHYHSIVPEIASRAAARLSRQLAPAALDLTSAELRGYVRARALGMIRTDVEQRSQSVNLSQSQAKQIVDAAVTLTAHLVARTLHGAPLVMPFIAPHISARPAVAIRAAVRPAIDAQRRAA